jgi:hypothetical protein
MMRIAFYNVTATYLTGGLETYCWEAGRALSRRGHQVSIVAGARGAARHDEVQLVQFPFRAEKEWPDLGVRFRRLAERASFARHAMDHLLQAGYDAIIINKPFDFPVLWRARQRGLKAATLFRSGGTDFFAGDRWFAGAVEHWVSASRYNAQQVTQRLADDMIKEFESQKVAQAKQKAEFIAREQEQAESRMDDAEKSLSTFAGDHPVMAAAVRGSMPGSADLLVTAQQAAAAKTEPARGDYITSHYGILHTIISLCS